VEIHKPREKEKRISERGNNDARMGRELYESLEPAVCGRHGDYGEVRER
jgi:hypothetical protein